MCKKLKPLLARQRSGWKILVPRKGKASPYATSMGRAAAHDFDERNMMVKFI
jgi:hypothetical protein